MGTEVVPVGSVTTEEVGWESGGVEGSVTGVVTGSVEGTVLGSVVEEFSSTVAINA